MDITVEELARLVGGRVSEDQASGDRHRDREIQGDHGGRKITAIRVTGVASIAEAGEGDVTFFGNARYLPALKATRACCALVPEDFQEPIPAIPIRVANPSLAFARVLEIFRPPAVAFQPGIHPTAVVGENVQLAASVSIQPHAVVEPGAVIGEGSVIGAGVYVGHEARIGSNCLIFPSVTIRERCILGNRVTIHSGTVVGSDGFGYELVQGRHVKIPQIGIVQIDDDVEIGANTSIDRARFGRTWIGEGTKIDNLVQIAHNVVIGKNSIIVSQVGISGSSRLGNYVTLAGQVGVVGHIEIGDQAVVAAQSGVSKSVPPRQVIWGSPAVPIREQKERLAFIARIPKLWERVKRLEQLLDSISKKINPGT